MASISRIIVGVDGHGGGWDALVLACQLARIDGAAITVACVYPNVAAAHATLVWVDIALESDATRVLGSARERLGDDHAADFVAAAGSTPGSTLQRLAAEHGADLIVVGSTRRATLGRALGANVVAQTLDHPTCPIAVAPRDMRESKRPIANVGVAVDGTPQSLAAVRWAGELTARSTAWRTIELINIDERAKEPVDRDHAAIDHLTDEDRCSAFAALPLAIRLGTTVRVGWTDAAGAVVPELARLTTQLDLLVIGTHGRGPLGRLLHGAVARDLADCARCPIVAVPLAQPPDQRPAPGKPGACQQSESVKT
ncbi:MAG: universal stress protein [Solirubrobacteraceae bacterium]